VPSQKRTVGGLLKRLLPGSRPAAGKGAPAAAKKKVWRISERAPGGEWVDADSAPAPLAREGEAGDTSSGGWLTSSMDLLSGTQVIEGQASEPAPPSPEEKTLPLGTRTRKK
jgi:hypothetical protein